MSVVSADIEPLSFVFEDDGLVPNNPMPFLVYKAAVDVANDHPASGFVRDAEFGEANIPEVQQRDEADQPGHGMIAESGSDGGWHSHDPRSRAMNGR